MICDTQTIYLIPHRQYKCMKYCTMFHAKHLTQWKLYDNCNIVVKIRVSGTQDGTELSSNVIRNTLIAIYLEQGHSVRKIKQLVKCGNDTIAEVRKGERVGSVQLAERIKKTLAARCTIASSIMLERATDIDKLDRASTFQLSGAAGLLMHNARLLDGESTHNVSVRSVHESISESQDKLNRMLKDTE